MSNSAPERRYPTTCPRCGEKKCTGRFALLTCQKVIDGKDGFAEAEGLIQARYAPATPVAKSAAPERPKLMQCFYSDDVLVPWEPPDKDKRPKAKSGPRVGDTKPFTRGSASAMHGECTRCVGSGGPIKAATWRRQHGVDVYLYSRESLCDEHARKVASPPIEVPDQFASAEEAQAWLDRITEEIAG